MKTFIFFYNKENYRINAKNSLSQDEIDKMVKKGFKYKEIEANNKEDVFLKIKKEGEINIRALEEYSGNTLFSAIIQAFLR